MKNKIKRQIIPCQKKNDCRQKSKNTRHLVAPGVSNSENRNAAGQALAGENYLTIIIRLLMTFSPALTRYT